MPNQRSVVGCNDRAAIGYNDRSIRGLLVAAQQALQCQGIAVCKFSRGIIEGDNNAGRIPARAGRHINVRAVILVDPLRIDLFVMNGGIQNNIPVKIVVDPRQRAVIRAVFTHGVSIRVQYDNARQPQLLGTLPQQLAGKLLPGRSLGLDICADLPGAFDGAQQAFGFGRFIIMGIGGALDLDIIYDARKIGLFAGLITLNEQQRDKEKQTYSQQRPTDPEFFARGSRFSCLFQEYPPQGIFPARQDTFR